jgi:predicted metal-dependent hydrolase
MTQKLRNRLADIFLGAFGDSDKRRAIRAFAAYCELSASRGSESVPLFDLMAALESARPETGEEDPALATINGAGLLRLRLGGDTEGMRAAEVEPYPEAREAAPVHCERVRRYRDVLEQAAAIETVRRTDRVAHALAEAALCFNAGLFFEAHEHLEHVWVSLPRGSVRQVLQGIIQVSVGFHHAERGNYVGAVNQLAKGLAKLDAGPSEVAGLDLAEFVRDVQAARQQMIARGREEVGPVPLANAPRMRLTR